MLVRVWLSFLILLFDSLMPLLEQSLDGVHAKVRSTSIVCIYLLLTMLAIKLNPIYSFVNSDIALQKGYEHKRKKAFNRARGVKCQSWFHFFAVWKEIGTNTEKIREAN